MEYTRLSARYLARLEEIAAEQAAIVAAWVPAAPIIRPSGMVAETSRNVWDRIVNSHKMWRFWMENTQLPQHTVSVGTVPASFLRRVGFGQRAA